jgi:hypothetical protein
MEIVYRADDGTEFYTEKACRDYELKTADFFILSAVYGISL